LHPVRACSRSAAAWVHRPASWHGAIRQVQFTCIDVSSASLDAAEAATRRAGIDNVAFELADARDYLQPAQPFDAALFCFVLEHVPHPETVLQHTLTLVRPGGTLMAIEGDHGSTFFYPPSRQAYRTIQCLIDLQAARARRCIDWPAPALSIFWSRRHWCTRGSPRRLHRPKSTRVGSKWFTERTYIAMVEGARELALAEGMLTEAEWINAGISDLRKAKQGSFSYTFFKAVARTRGQ